ncbi:MAG: hypothetical protein BWY87_01170 [Deltaproteobacteria bacterium ADurb.Bin510]|nr:MAG: hypothetical protein BWY87_01170 [Deltaproteobacteria bacterium ADurb.Bin510]
MTISIRSRRLKEAQSMVKMVSSRLSVRLWACWKLTSTTVKQMARVMSGVRP